VEENEIRAQFNIPADAVLTRQVETKRYFSFLFEHQVSGIWVDGDRIVVKVDKKAETSELREFNWQDIKIKRKVALPSKGKPVLIEPENPFYVWDKKPKKHHQCVFEWEGAQLTIKDADTGEVIGHGVPSPTEKALAVSGPDSGMDVWKTWRTYAAAALAELGFDVKSAFFPNEISDVEIREAIQSPETKAVYGIAHGGSYTCYLYSSTQIQSWLSGRDKMPFTFLGHCDGMCQLDGFSSAFRKGSVEGAATVGYCGMSTSACASAWSKSWAWQNSFFQYLIQGEKCGDAFEMAIADYPECADCIRFAGDENLILKGGEMANVLVQVSVVLEKKLYDIEVTVTEESTGLALDGTNLVLQSVGEGVTDSSGKFTFVSVPYGIYTLEVNKTGYVPASKDVACTV
jgi:hypothetical protein